MSVAGNSGAACELCSNPGGEILWSDQRCRVIRVDDAAFPGYCRVVWNAHAVEMTDLAADDRRHLMAVVFSVESAVRTVTQAAKINLASFGNVVPHLHWHIIPRWQDDSHFPQAVWGSRQREGALRSIDQVALQEKICKLLANNGD